MSNDEKKAFDPSIFRITPGPTSEVRTERHLSIIPVRKPGKQDYVRVHPSERFRHPCGLFMLKGDERPYMVAPHIYDAFQEDMKLVELRLTIDRQGHLLLWPVPQPPVEGKEHSYNFSQRAAADEAEDQWLRMYSIQSLGQYESKTAESNIPDPEWPDRTMTELLEIAFSDEHIIDKLEHPAIKTLLGAI